MQGYKGISRYFYGDFSFFAKTGRYPAKGDTARFPIFAGALFTLQLCAALIAEQCIVRDGCTALRAGLAGLFGRRCLGSGSFFSRRLFGFGEFHLSGFRRGQRGFQAGDLALDAVDHLDVFIHQRLVFFLALGQTVHQCAQLALCLEQLALLIYDQSLSLALFGQVQRSVLAFFGIFQTHFLDLVEIGVGEPSGHPYQGHIFQLATVLGVEEENGFTLNYDKYNWEEHPDHFILQDADQPVDFGEGKRNIYALEGTEVLVQRNKEVQMAAHDFGKGRAVYISGVPYSFANSRTLYRAILWSAHSEEELHTWFSSNYNVEVHAYVKNGKYCVVNNTYEPQDTTVYTTDGSSFALHLDANEIKWYEI